MEEKSVVWTTHTHRLSTPSVFLHNHNNEPVASTYFEQRVPVPEDDSEVIWTCDVCMHPSINPDLVLLVLQLVFWSPVEGVQFP